MNNTLALNFLLPAMIAAQFHRQGMEHYKHELAPGVAESVAASDVAWLIEQGYVAGKIRENAEGKPMVIAFAGVTPLGLQASRCARGCNHEIED